MTAAIQDIQTNKIGTDEIPPPNYLALPVEAGKTIFGGTMVCSNAAGNAVNAGDAGALMAWGRCERQVVNAGAAGLVTVLMRPGAYYLAQDGTITVANVGQPCFFVDDSTVSLSPGGTTACRPFAGIILPPAIGEAGIFLPVNTKVAVYVGAPGPANLVLRYTVSLTLAQIQATASGTAFNLGVPLPTNARLLASEINVPIALSGGGATAVTASLSGGTDAAASILAAQSVFTGAAPVNATPGTNPYAARGGQQIKMVITTTTGTNPTLAAGVLSVDLFYSIA